MQHCVWQGLPIAILLMTTISFTQVSTYMSSCAYILLAFVQQAARASQNKQLQLHQI